MVRQESARDLAALVGPQAGRVVATGGSVGTLAARRPRGGSGGVSRGVSAGSTGGRLVGPTRPQPASGAATGPRRTSRPTRRPDGWERDRTNTLRGRSAESDHMPGGHVVGVELLPVSPDAAKGFYSATSSAPPTSGGRSLSIRTCAPKAHRFARTVSGEPSWVRAHLYMGKDCVMPTQVRQGD